MSESVNMIQRYDGHHIARSEFVQSLRFVLASRILNSQPFLIHAPPGLQPVTSVTTKAERPHHFHFLVAPPGDSALCLAASTSALLGPGMSQPRPRRRCEEAWGSPSRHSLVQSLSAVPEGDEDTAEGRP